MVKKNQRKGNVLCPSRNLFYEYPEYSVKLTSGEELRGSTLFLSASFDQIPSRVETKVSFFLFIPLLGFFFVFKETLYLSNSYYCDQILAERQTCRQAGKEEEREEENQRSKKEGREGGREGELMVAHNLTV